MKVLINIPHLSLSGGVGNHYKGLRPFWSMKVSYNEVGRRFGLPGFMLLPYDYLKFMVLCVFGGYDVIVLNPSLGKTALKRDGLFLRVAKVFGKSVQVFFHGWSPDMVTEISANSSSFIKTYNKANGFFVLAESFRQDLRQWGITKPIQLTTTKVEDSLLEGFSVNHSNTHVNILFLTRIEEYKGVFIALEAYRLLKQQCADVTLTIAGDGSKLQEVKEAVLNKNISDVEFLGHVSNEKLKRAFNNADIYVLPSYSEGMPTSVLEAMAFGLPIVSRPVGGLVDFFENDKMGHLIESLDPNDFYKIILNLVQDDNKRHRISEYNHKYATQNFLASKVVVQLENIISNV
jgi:glycosyltransferase involved in cell wall biosynthesis